MFDIIKTKYMNKCLQHTFATFVRNNMQEANTEGGINMNHNDICHGSITTREQRIRNKMIRRKLELRRKMILFLLTFCLVITVSIGISGFLSNAKNPDSRISYKYYTSITVSGDDTLWSIAEKYMDPEHYQSANDYIQEVKNMNHLKNDVITYGEHLIVPYYMDAYLE